MEKEKIYRLDNKKWYIERAVYFIAGVFVFLSVLLGAYAHQGFFYFTAFVGLMLINFGLSGYCPMSIILQKLGMKSRIEK